MIQRRCPGLIRALIGDTVALASLFLLLWCGLLMAAALDPRAIQPTHAEEIAR